MISVINKDFFTMRRYTVKLENKTDENTKNFITLVNLYTDPKNAELNKYEKKAFLSYVFKSDFNPEERLTESDIYDIMESCEVNQYSMYSDPEYELFKDTFPSEIRYPTIIFEAVDNYTAKNLCLIAMPVKGIIPTIKKSEMYKLYNGSLVVCKPFKYQPVPDAEYEFYNKLIYILVDIKTAFNFTEYITTSDEFYGVMKSYNFFLTIKENKEETPDDPDGKIDLAISLKILNSLVPYRDRREEFFVPGEPNIFRLSDIPHDIYVKHSSIMKELRVDKV